MGNLGTVSVSLIKDIAPEPDDLIDLVDPINFIDLLPFTLVSLALGIVGIFAIALFVSVKRK